MTDNAYHEMFVTNFSSPIHENLNISNNLFLSWIKLFILAFGIYNLGIIIIHAFYDERYYKLRIKQPN